MSKGSIMFNLLKIKVARITSYVESEKLEKFFLSGYA